MIGELLTRRFYFSIKPFSPLLVGRSTRSIRLDFGRWGFAQVRQEASPSKGRALDRFLPLARMKSLMPKKITLEHLAQLVKRGFDETATKQELHQGLQSLAERMSRGFTAVDEELAGIRADVRELKTDMKEVKVVLYSRGPAAPSAACRITSLVARR